MTGRITFAALFAAALLASADQSLSAPPTISRIPDYDVAEDSQPFVVRFTVQGDTTPVDAIDVSVSSSDSSLISSSALTVSANGSQREIRLAPAPDRAGTSIITVTATNKNKEATSVDFTFRVREVNDAPTITTVPDQRVAVGTSMGPMIFLVSDIDDSVSNLVVTGRSSNQQLCPNKSISIQGDDSQRTVTITASESPGAAAITLTAQDGKGGETSTTFSVMFEAPETDSAAYVAAINRSGTLFAAAIGLGGTLISLAITYMSHRQKVASDRRIQTLKEGEAERQRLSTFISSFGLLSTSEGREVSGTQRSAVLLVLAGVGELEYALMLLGPMWRDQDVDTPSAVWLLSKAFDNTTRSVEENVDLDKDASLKLVAANTLFANRHRLYLENGTYAWPSSIDKTWPSGFSYEVTDYILQTQIDVVAGKPEPWDLEPLAGAFVQLQLMADRIRWQSLQRAATKASLLVLEVLERVATYLWIVDEHGCEVSTTPQELRRMLTNELAALEESGGAEAEIPADMTSCLSKLERWSNDEKEAYEEEACEEVDEEEGVKKEGESSS